MASKKVSFNKQGIQKLPDDKPVLYRIETAGGKNNYTGVAKRGRVQERLVEHLPGGKDPIPGARYNIGGTHSCSVGDILNTLLGMSPMKDRIRIEVDPDRLRPIDADLQVPDTSKFTQHTGWEPRIPFEDTMRDLLDYWRARVRRDGGAYLTR